MRQQSTGGHVAPELKPTIYPNRGKNTTYYRVLTNIEHDQKTDTYIRETNKYLV